MKKLSTKIWVTFQRKGLHFYPQAATDPTLADVKYLGSEHRHLFHFNVGIQVFHDDRELEFHQFLNWIENLYNSKTLQLNHKSCEMIADDLAEQIAARYPGRHLMITVAEDQECGSTTEYET